MPAPIRLRLRCMLSLLPDLDPARLFPKPSLPSSPAPRLLADFLHTCHFLAVAQEMRESM